MFEPAAGVRTALPSSATPSPESDISIDPAGQTAAFGKLRSSTAGAESAAAGQRRPAVPADTAGACRPSAAGAAAAVVGWLRTTATSERSRTPAAPPSSGGSSLAGQRSNGPFRPQATSTIEHQQRCSRSIIGRTSPTARCAVRTLPSKRCANFESAERLPAQTPVPFRHLHPANRPLSLAIADGSSRASPTSGSAEGRSQTLHDDPWLRTFEKKKQEFRRI